MFLLFPALVVGCWSSSCEQYVGLSKRRLLSYFSGTENGLSTVDDRGDVVYVHTEHIPDDSVKTRDVRLRIVRGADGVERVSSCDAKESCRRGSSMGLCL